MRLPFAGEECFTVGYLQVYLVEFYEIMFSLQNAGLHYCNFQQRV